MAISAIIGGLGSTALLPLIGIIAGVAAVITIIITAIQNWGAITEWLGNVWTSITTAIQDTADKIFTAIGQAIDNFGQNWEDFWNEMSNFVSWILDSITQTASDAWEWLKQSVSDLIRSVTDNFQKFKDNVANIWENIKNTVGSICGNIKNTVVNIWNGILDTVSDLMSNMISNAYNWGSDFIQGLKNGIMSKVNAIIDAVRNVADSIRSFLHFSRPDEGPLRDYETWMPDMMEGLANGIYDNIDKIKTAAKAVSGEINSTINGNVNGMVQTASIPATKTIIIQGDTMILDGEVIGKTAERRITNGQISTQAAKGRRVNVRRV